MTTLIVLIIWPATNFVIVTVSLLFLSGKNGKTKTLFLDGRIEEFTASRHPKIESRGSRVIPFGKEVYIERDDFFDLEGPEGKQNGGKPPKGYKRLLPTEKVRLRYAYVIQCDKIIRDAETQEPIELVCTYYPETKAGNTPEGMSRVKGIIHWVEASTCVSCKVNMYDRLFSTEEPGKESGDYLNDLNPKSLEVLDGVVLEPSVLDDAKEILKQREENGNGDDDDDDAEEKSYDASSLAYQFERNGYFALDKDSSPDGLVFNRVVTLRDTWGGKNTRGGNDNNAANVRTRGDNKGGVEAASGQAKATNNNGEPAEDILRVAFRVGTILEAGPHPEADSLLVCQVDCGDVDEDGNISPRTVVAGLAGKIDIDDLVGSKVVTVTNLKPAKMRGIESTAMLLAASDGKEGDEETVELLNVPSDVPNGELLNIEGKDPSTPDPMMKSKGALKAFDRVKSCLRTNSDGEAEWMTNEGKKSSHRFLTSSGPVTTKSLKDSIIQ